MGMDKREAVNVFLMPKVKKAFRLKCVVADHTMQSAVDWFIEQVVNGKVQLPPRRPA